MQVIRLWHTLRWRTGRDAASAFGYGESAKMVRMSEQAADVRLCGRPTRSGKPCRTRLAQLEFACAKHAGDHDRELAAAYQRGREEGYELGKKIGSNDAKVEWLERRVRELEQRLDDAERYYEFGGDQVIEVGRYAYRWRGDTPLEVGDRVLLPQNWLSRMKDGPGPTEGVVTGLGATYRGELSFIIGRAGPSGT